MPELSCWILKQQLKIGYLAKNWLFICENEVIYEKNGKGWFGLLTPSERMERVIAIMAKIFSKVEKKYLRKNRGPPFPPFPK